MTAKREKGETHLLEWKESWCDESPKWLCGFANADGGTLIIGMNDKGAPVGAPIAGRLLVDLQTTSQPLNPDIANTCFPAGLIEAWGRPYEQSAPEATVESDGNGVRVKWGWVNPASHADRIRPQDKSQDKSPHQWPNQSVVCSGRLMRGSRTPSHIQVALGLMQRATFEWRAHD